MIKISRPKSIIQFLNTRTDTPQERGVPQMRLLFLILVSGLLSACTTFPTEKIMKVHQGMSSTEILEMFGNPKNVSQAVCGGNTGLQWTCTTWQYGYSDFGDSASFTFSGEPGNLVLNNFSFNRK